MAAEPDNIVLVYLRRIDEKVDRIGDDVRDLKMRVPALEEMRPDRIEKRLDLTEAPR